MRGIKKGIRGDGLDSRLEYGVVIDSESTIRGRQGTKWQSHRQGAHFSYIT